MKCSIFHWLLLFVIYLFQLSRIPYSISISIRMNKQEIKFIWTIWLVRQLLFFFVIIAVKYVLNGVAWLFECGIQLLYQWIVDEFFGVSFDPLMLITTYIYYAPQHLESLDHIPSTRIIRISSYRHRLIWHLTINTYTVHRTWEKLENWKFTEGIKNTTTAYEVYAIIGSQSTLWSKPMRMNCMELIKVNAWKSDSVQANRILTNSSISYSNERSDWTLVTS